MTLTDFLQAEARAFGVEEDRHHKAIFEEHIRVQGHRLRLLATQLTKLKDRLLDRKASVSVTGQIARLSAGTNKFRCCADLLWRMPALSERSVTF